MHFVFLTRVSSAGVYVARNPMYVLVMAAAMYNQGDEQFAHTAG